MATEVDLREEAAPAASLAPERREQLHAAAEAASARLPDGHDVRIVSFDGTTGNAAVIVSDDAPPDQDDFVRRALAHVQDVGPALGLAPEQPPEFRADPAYQQTSADGVAVHLRQQYKGIGVYGATVVTAEPLWRSTSEILIRHLDPDRDRPTADRSGH